MTKLEQTIKNVPIEPEGLLERINVYKKCWDYLERNYTPTRKLSIKEYTALGVILASPGGMIFVGEKLGFPRLYSIGMELTKDFSEGLMGAILYSMLTK